MRKRNRTAILKAIVAALILWMPSLTGLQAEDHPVYKNFDLLETAYDFFESRHVPRYNKNGLVFPEQDNAKASRFYQDFVKNVATEDLIHFFLNALKETIEITEDEQGQKVLIIEECTHMPEGVMVGFLAVLFQKSPQAAEFIAHEILKNDRLYYDCIPQVLMDDCNIPKSPKRCWPAADRAIFYLLMKNMPEDRRNALVKTMRQNTNRLFVLADTAIYRQASSLVRNHYLENGDWPHPDVLPAKERPFFLDAKKRSQKKKAAGLLCRNFPEAPLFWFMGSWESKKRTKLLTTMLSTSRVVGNAGYTGSFPVYAYECLVEDGALEAFQKLMKGRGPGGVYGAAGAIEVLAAQNKFDGHMVLRQLRRKDEVPVGLSCVIRHAQWGEAVLDYLGFDCGVPQVFQKFPEKWLSLCEEKKGLSTRIKNAIRKVHGVNPSSTTDK